MAHTGHAPANAEEILASIGVDGGAMIGTGAVEEIDVDVTVGGRRAEDAVRIVAEAEVYLVKISKGQ